MTLVTQKHLKQAGICAKGARKWWRDRGLDWSDFLTNGIPATTLEQFDDEHTRRVIEYAEADNG